MQEAWQRAVLMNRHVLGQKRAGSSAGVLARLWTWQLWRRTVRRPLVLRCAEGSLLLAPAWSRLAAAIAATGLTEPDDSLFVLDVLRPDDLFVDVGANIGYYTVLAARRGAAVRAYEPTAQATESIERSLELNGVHAEVRRVACGRHAGVAPFRTGRDISNHIVTDGPGDIDVPVVTLDDELEGVGAELAVFKIDAENQSVDVLRGALRAVERLQPVILVEVWTGGHAPLSLLQPWDYRPYRYDSAAREMSEIPAAVRGDRNLLLVPDSRLAAVRDRLASAQRPDLRAPALRPSRAVLAG